MGLDEVGFQDMHCGVLEFRFLSVITGRHDTRHVL
jgi:hypothetical protein